MEEGEKKMTTLKVTIEDLRERSYLTGENKSWVDIGEATDDYFQQYRHFGASLTFTYSTKFSEWVLSEITISDPKHRNIKSGEIDFGNYVLDTPFGITNRFKYDGVINYAFDGEEPYILKELLT